MIHCEEHKMEQLILTAFNLTSRCHRPYKNAAVPDTQKTAEKQIHLRRYRVGLRALRTKETTLFIFDNDANFLYNIMTLRVVHDVW